MEEIVDEADALKMALEKVLNRMELLRDAAEHIGADSCYGYADDACDSIRSAIRSMEDIWFEA